MKKNQLKELQTKTAAELNSLLGKGEIELAKLKMDLRAGKLKDVRSLNKKRHDLARMRTILRNQQLTKGEE